MQRSRLTEESSVDGATIFYHLSCSEKLHTDIYLHMLYSTDNDVLSSVLTYDFNKTDSSLQPMFNIPKNHGYKTTKKIH